MILLHTLPHDHPLRNKPLGEIGAEVNNMHYPGVWHSIFRQLRPLTYNDIALDWSDDYMFRAPEQS